MTVQPRIFLLLPSFAPRDAIGNDVLGMYRVLRAEGYEVRIFAEHINEKFREIASVPAVDFEYWACTTDVLVYHHSISWPLGEAILMKARNRIAIKYHNVTPARFFAQYARHYYQACADGELSTRRVAHHPSAMFWGASRYNAEELITHGAARDRCRWVAPFHLVEELNDTPLDTATLGRFRDDCFNILFVGGMKPNKGHALALHAFAAYRHIYSSDARILFAGSYDQGLSSYFESVRDLVVRLDLSGHVMFEHSVSAAQLKTFYYAADVFLCASEHEGFCVPLVEAMAMRVPIIALGQSAVPETLGDAGVLWERFDPLVFAESIEKLRRDPKLRAEVAESGRRRYESEYHPEVLARKILSLVEELRN